MRNDFPRAALKVCAWDQHAPPALYTAQANISPQAHNQPLIAAAGVNFAQA
jgi:hypothetical protein